MPTSCLKPSSHSLARHKVTPGTQIVLANRQGQTIAYENFSQAIKYSDGPDGRPVLANVTDLGIPACSEQLATTIASRQASDTQNLTLNVDGAQMA